MKVLESADAGRAVCVGKLRAGVKVSAMICRCEAINTSGLSCLGGGCKSNTFLGANLRKAKE